MGLKKEQKLPGYVLILGFAFIIPFIVRIFLSANFSDEPFNIGESFRTVMGVSFLTENWDFFQTGDSFIYPFVKLFYVLTGSSAGLVLFSRFLYVTAMILLSILEYNLLKRNFGAKNSFAAVLIVNTSVSFKMFFLHYDNNEMIFQAAGFILLFYYYENCADFSKFKRFFTLAFTGVFHAAMVYSYPTTIVAVLYTGVLLLALKPNDNGRFKQLFSYGAGIFVVFAAFVILVLVKGPENLFIFNNGARSAGVSGRQDFFEMSGIILNLKKLIKKNLLLYLKPLIVLALAFVISIVFRKKKFTVAVVPVAMIVGSVILAVSQGITKTDTTNHIMAYLSTYTFLLILLLSEEKKKQALKLILTVQIPSYICGAMYGFTALNGAYKFSQGAKTAAIVAFLLLFEFIAESQIKKSDCKKIVSAIMTLFVLSNAFILYSSAFQGTDPVKCNKRVPSGVFKGIYDSEEVVNEILEFENNIKLVTQEGDKTITCGSHCALGYLQGTLKPNTNYLWSPGNRKSPDEEKTADILEYYYNKYYGFADVFVIRNDGIETESPKIMEFIESNYKLVIKNDIYSFYRLAK